VREALPKACALLAAAALACAALAGPAQAQKAPRSIPAVTDVAAAELPPEARQALALIRKGGPYPYAKDGAVFANREGILPRQKRGYYREYTVKTPHERTRGARRIIAGSGGDFYYTDDHYNHFRRIRE
jgi:ribonuclease T1